jgi:hypothetical protein
LLYLPVLELVALLPSHSTSAGDNALGSAGAEEAEEGVNQTRVAEGVAERDLYSASRAPSRLHAPPAAGAQGSGMQQDAHVTPTETQRADEAGGESAGGLKMESKEALRELCVLLHGMLQAHGNDTGMTETVGPLLAQLSSLRYKFSKLFYNVTNTVNMLGY